MRRGLILFLFTVLVAFGLELRARPAAAQVAAAPPAPPWTAVLQEWYERVGGPRPGEPFGELVLRAARAQVGKPYVRPPETGQAESLLIDLDGFECVSLVDAALAVARCLWMDSADQACFEREMLGLRYRDGRIEDFSSRLHYYSEWLAEQDAHGRIELLSEQLGGQHTPFTFDYMSQRAQRYPAMQDPEIAARIAAVEQRLSAEDRVWLDREAIAPIHDQLQNGDIVAIVGNRPGIFIRHVGIVDIAPDGRPRLLHASSLLERVAVSKGSVSSYVLWNDRRLGAVFARPLPPAVPPSFSSSTEPLSGELRAEMTGVSWHEGCPVALDDLRLLRLSHWTLDGHVATGELVVAASVAPAVERIFEALYRARFPIARMERIERFGGSDDRSMAANNSSAFNCRTVAGTRSWSQHAYGVAIDINPIQNPWVRGAAIDPPLGAAFIDRTVVEPGMVVEGDPVVSAFDAEGWSWGGRWTGTRDYQHFSVNGR
jgi:hypothetical protein